MAQPSYSDDEWADGDVRRYPARDRLPPTRFGGGTGGPSGDKDPAAAISNAKPGTGHGMRRNLPTPPKIVREARQREDWPQWEAAVGVAKASMVRNGVCRRQAALAGTRPLKTKVLFDYKIKQSRELDRYKCRLAGMGCRQHPGLDYNETCAPVSAAAITRMLLSTAEFRGWHVHHVDGRTAYINAPMDMDVYIIIPDGFDDASEEALLH